MKVLIVNNEEETRNVIKEHCLLENYEVFEAIDGVEALDVINNYEIDIVVLDDMMPKMCGNSTLKVIRKQFDVPIIIISTCNDESDKLLSFQLGVDDYLTKPFSPKELIARIKAITSRKQVFSDKYIYKTMIVDYLGHKVTVDNEEIKLTPKEYELLCFFIQNKGVALSRETLLSKIWKYNSFGEDRTVDTHVKMLRNNLQEYRDLIITVRGVGYKFDER